MHIGFTGTREGMTKFQRYRFVLRLHDILSDTKDNIFHHGDCIGSDADAHDLIQKNFPDIKIHIHPPVNETHRAFCEGGHIIKHPQTHFKRNRNIVDECDLLITTPLLNKETSTGGTWYTINYARKQSKDIVILWPNRTVKEEYV